MDLHVARPPADYSFIHILNAYAILLCAFWDDASKRFDAADGPRGPKEECTMVYPALFIMVCVCRQLPRGCLGGGARQRAP